MKKFLYGLTAFISLLLVSCASSKSVTTLAKGNDLSKYKYVVFGSKDEGNAFAFPREYHLQYLIKLTNFQL